MKRILNGKLYDTETANRISQWSESGRHLGDHGLNKELYRTANGNWFTVTSWWDSEKQKFQFQTISDMAARSYLEEVNDQASLEIYFDIEDA